MRARTGVVGALLTAIAALGLIASFSAPATAGSASDQVSAARHATAAFPHPAAAKRAGYALLHDANGIACISMKGMGGMGVHYVNGALVDAKVQARHPEALVYRFTNNGHLRLAALEYVVIKSVWKQAHGADAPRPSLFGHSFNFTPAGNRFGLPAFYSLHAWLWYKNPAGTFQMWNPRVSCSGGI